MDNPTGSTSIFTAPASASDSPAALGVEGEQVPRVVGNPVEDLRRRDPGAVGQRPRELDPVLLRGQLLADHRPIDVVSEVLGHVGVVRRSPYPGARTGERLHQRTAGRTGLPLAAPDEAAGLVGLVELPRPDPRPGVPRPAPQGLLEDAVDDPVEMEHEVAPEQTRAVRQAVRESAARGGEEQPRGADRICRAHDQVRPLEVQLPVGIAPLGPRGQSAVVKHDAGHPRSGDDGAAPRHDVAPMREVGRALGAFGASRVARPPLDARVAPVVGGGEDRVGVGPPVPSQARLGASEAQTAGLDRERGERGVGARRVGRIAAQARDTDLAVGLLVVRKELVVGDRPVVAVTAQRS